MALALQPSPQTLSPRSPPAHHTGDQPTRDLQLAQQLATAGAQLLGDPVDTPWGRPQRSRADGRRDAANPIHQPGVRELNIWPAVAARARCGDRGARLAPHSVENIPIHPLSATSESTCTA